MYPKPSIAMNPLEINWFYEKHFTYYSANFQLATFYCYSGFAIWNPLLNKTQLETEVNRV